MHARVRACAFLLVCLTCMPSFVLCVYLYLRFLFVCLSACNFCLGVCAWVCIVRVMLRVSCRCWFSSKRVQSTHVLPYLLICAVLSARMWMHAMAQIFARRTFDIHLYPPPTWDHHCSKICTRTSVQLVCSNAAMVEKINQLWNQLLARLWTQLCSQLCTLCAAGEERLLDCKAAKLLASQPLRASPHFDFSVLLGCTETHLFSTRAHH